MKKIIIITSVIILSLNVLQGQNGSIHGIVSDQTTTERIPFAAVSVVSEGGTLLKGTNSNDNGSFILDNLSHGNYKLLVSFLGYQTDTISGIILSRQKPKINLGSIQLKPASVNLDQVEITTSQKTSTSKIDRKSYRAADFETAKGGTATDLLNKLPSVSVDPDGSVSVRGTTDFMVYLNGKPTQLDPSTLLGQIAGSRIENIEIISIPTAKYDAQGKGGIININTKTTGAEGFSVSANGLTGGAPWSNVTDKYSGFKNNDNRYGGGINLLYFKDKITLYGGVNANHRNVNGRRTGDARILVKDNVYRHMVAQGERPEWFGYFSANAGFDYRVSPGSTFSGSCFYGNRTEGRSAFYIYNNYYSDINNTTVQGVDRREAWIYNPNTDDRLGEFRNGNLDFVHNFNKTSELKISALYEHSDLTRKLSNENYEFNRAADQFGARQLQYKQTDDTPLDGYRFSADYSAQLENGSKLGLGFQPQFLQIDGGFKYDTLDLKTGILHPYTDLENGLDLTRTIYAGYVDYSGKIKKVDYIAGLRMEYTNQEVAILSANYFSLFDETRKSNYKTKKLDLFHTLHLAWELNDREKLTFASSRRISRPPLKNMAPFLYRRHLEVYEVGDPRLQPEYLMNAELSFDQKIAKHSLNFTAFYRGVNNAVFRVNTITNENARVFAVTKEEVLIRSYTNTGNSNSLGAELNMNIDAGKLAKFFIGGSLYNFKVKGDIFGYQVNNSSTNWSVKANMNLNISKEIKFAADLNLKSASITAQGQNDLFYLANAAINYTPVKLKGWDFSIRLLDFLGSNLEGLDTQAFNKQGKEIFYQETEYFRKGGIVELGVTYSFNLKGKNGKKSESMFGKEQF
jgi:hypothetical protein